MNASANLCFYNLPWRDLPGARPENEEIFAIEDVHGEAELLNAALSSIASIPRTVSKKHLGFFGDLIDRGTASIVTVNLTIAGKEQVRRLSTQGATLINHSGSI